MEIEVKNYESIQKKLEYCKEGDTLLLEDGVYHEKIEIWKNSICIRAKNPKKAIITNHDYYHKIMPNHNECNTFNTFTVFVGGNHVTIKDIIIENSSTPSEIYGQAVALHVDGNYFNCENCIIKSAQDTLFTGPMPDDLLLRYQGFYLDKRLKGSPSFQKYQACEIIGDVDFIFGGATALFQKCKIISLKQRNNHIGFVCAPSHSKATPFGYLFYDCDITGSTPTYLARPWRDYGCCAFIKCRMGEHIVKEGFNKWNNTNRDQTARFYEYTPTVDCSQRVPWSHQLSASEAEDYISEYGRHFVL